MFASRDFFIKRWKRVGSRGRISVGERKRRPFVSPLKQRRRLANCAIPLPNRRRSSLSFHN